MVKLGDELIISKFWRNYLVAHHEELGLVKISLSSVINKTDNLTERVDTLEEKVDEINVTLKSSNW